ncbi:MAG: DUF5615 family PIN-like protein [Oscillochloridaceae bacterium umkhey_bin13]
MLRFAADENFNFDIVRGMMRRSSTIDIVRIQDVGLSGADDPTVLAWSAAQDRVLLTHDVATITSYERVRAAQAMPGVIEVSRSLPLGKVIDDLLLIAECSIPGAWEGQVTYLPLR